MGKNECKMDGTTQIAWQMISHCTYLRSCELVVPRLAGDLHGDTAIQLVRRSHWLTEGD